LVAIVRAAAVAILASVAIVPSAASKV